MSIISGGDTIKVNVGGRIFETTKETLLLCGPNSKIHEAIANMELEKKPLTNGIIPPSLANGFTSSPVHNPPTNTTPQIFFDRDPECFEHILFYLRTASLAGVKEMTTLEKLKVESEFYGLGPSFQDMLRGKERFLNLTTRSAHVTNVRKEVDMKKTYTINLQIVLDEVADYVKWDIERNENIIRIAIGHRTQCSTQMRYQVTEGDTYNLKMKLTITTRLNETNKERLEKHVIKSIKSQFNAEIKVLSMEETTHCGYCERMLTNAQGEIVSGDGGSLTSVRSAACLTPSTPVRSATISNGS